MDWIRCFIVVAVAFPWGIPSILPGHAFSTSRIVSSVFPSKTTRISHLRITASIIPPEEEEGATTAVGVIVVPNVNGQVDTTAIASTTTDDDDDDDDKDTNTPWLQSIDGIVYVSYLCNVLALSLPVLLVPVAATHSFAATSTTDASATLTVGFISSIATLGGAVGKFVNGFVCQALGSYASSKYYLMGLGMCGFLFSISPNPICCGLAFAGMEFFASIQWASLAVMLTKYYVHDPPRLAVALTALGLSSTSGQIAAKTIGMTLASKFHWRTVGILGAVTAILGAAVIAKAPKPTNYNNHSPQKLQFSSIVTALREVLGSRVFWLLGLSHAMAFVARGTDRILGMFFQHVGGLPPAIAGGLTLSITFGLIQGLTSGSEKISKLESVQQQTQFLAKRYALSVLATLGLACLAPWNHVSSSSLLRWTLAGGVAASSLVMARNIAFQYFQFPAMVARAHFPQHSAVVISFLDGFGFFLSAPVFGMAARLVATKFGWTSAWAMLAGLFGIAALTMLANIGPVLAATTITTTATATATTTKTASTSTIPSNSATLSHAKVD
jgi:MFS family permease